MSEQLLSLFGKIDQAETAVKFELQPLASSEDAIQVLVEDQQEFPIAVTQAENELICMVRLFGESEIKDGEQLALANAMLAANLALPLSSFAKAGDDYYLTGTLAATSKIESIAIEIETLAGNTVEALELVAEFLE